MTTVPAFAAVQGMRKNCSPSLITPSSLHFPAACCVVLPAFAVVALPVVIVPCSGLAVAAAPPPSAPAVPAPSTKKEKEVSPKDPPAKESAKTPPGAGLPAPLVALLRDAAPFRANEIYSTIPSDPLLPIEEETPAPEWYAILRGRFVGVVDEYLLSDFAITGVAQGARKAYDTQANALRAFNKALTWGGVEIL
ncbi:hypothetical protein R3P38DRAFT_3195453 [Favolaschia claudopus]|uniref:Uncharacterized protein n=1 Tax=Favolaschia claudopus TaxID=2862362 RepID=A0AAW0BAU5_9AGAR